MELLNTAVTAGVLLAVGTMLGFFMNGRFRKLEGEIAGLGRRIEKLGDQMAVMRSDLTHVALAVGARKKPDTG